MRTITNISNITDNSGTAPIVTYSNAVQTLIQDNPRTSIPRICDMIFVHSSDGCGFISICDFNNFALQNHCSCNHCGCGQFHCCGTNCSHCECNNHNNCNCGYGCESCSCRNNCNNW